MIKSVLIILSLLLLLSSCAVSPSDDPYAMRAQADAAIQATQRAAIQEARAATLEAASTKQASEAEIALLNARLDATARALSYVQTQAASTQQARDDQATQMAMAVIGTQTAVSYSATQTVVRLAVVAAQAKAERDQHTADFWANVLPVGIFILLIVCAVGAGIILWRAKDWMFEWRNRKNSIYNTTIGPVVVLPDGTFQLLQDIYHSRMRPLLDGGGSSDVQWIGKSTTISQIQRHEPDGITVQARRLLQLAIEQEGPATMKIPGWRAAGMTSDGWQRVIGALKFAGVVETQAGEGTFVTYEHQTAAYVLDEIQTGKVRVRPAPPPGMSVRSV